MPPGIFPWTGTFPGARRGCGRVASRLKPGASPCFGAFRVFLKKKGRPFYFRLVLFDMLFGTFHQADRFPDRILTEMALSIHASAHLTPSADLIRVCYLLFMP